MLTIALIIFIVYGSVSICQGEIDLNRIHQLPNDLSPVYNYPANTNNRRSIHNNFLQGSDNDELTDGSAHSSLHIKHTPKQTMDFMESIETNRPREDPRAFYQSDAYLKDIMVQNINPEVAFIYPGREVVRADEEYKRPGRLRKMIKSLTLDSDDHTLCVRCPHDRTLVAKVGSDKVVLQSPRLTSCAGRRVPRQVHFVHLYGPKLGSLLNQGSHIIVGKIMYNSQVLQLCKMQVHVLLQSCPVPKTLKAHCNDRTKSCNFTCRDPRSEVKGMKTLVCGDNLNWQGKLPVCRARNWCMPQLPPEHGRISCKGLTVDQTPGLLEGSRCRVRCAYGWRASHSTVAVCRRGTWSQELQCQPRNNRR